MDILDKLVRKHFPMTPRGIIDHLKLRRPNLSSKPPPMAISVETNQVHLGKDR